MKSFYHSYYRFYKPSQKEHKIFAISDVHFSDHTTDNLAKTAEFAARQKPQIITISGDLVDNLEVVDATANRARLKAWLERLGKIAPVCICLGNHDFYRKPADFKSGLSKKRGYIAEKSQQLIDEINEINNIYLLDNAVYEDKEFYVQGLTLPPEYYNFDYKTEKQESISNPGTESKKVLLEQLELIKTTDLPKHKTKILLVHSPARITEKSVAKKLTEFDFIFAGHMHNGVVPPLLNEIWRGHSGILTPDKHLFANQNTRIGLYGNNLIVLGALTTVQSGAGRIAFINHIFPVYVATVETTKNDIYARKPDIHHKYHK
jgi:predicted MPP superfamily phosphohydrolase